MAGDSNSSLRRRSREPVGPRRGSPSRQEIELVHYGISLNSSAKEETDQVLGRDDEVSC